MNARKLGKYNLVAIGMRDFYQVAIALKEAGRLRRLITDFYTPDWLRERISKRWSNLLSSRDTTSIYPTAPLSIKLVATRYNRARMILVDDMFGFIAGMLTYFGCNRAVVYSYYLHGFVSFYRMIGRRPDDLVCFQVHPSPWFINDLMDDDRRKFEEVAPIKFLEDIEGAFTARDMDNYKRALSYCSSVIAASDVTRRSIADATDIPIHVVPYGSKIEDQTDRTAPGRWQSDDKIRLVSVCQLTQRKGMHWAFAAMTALPPEARARFEWIVVSNFRDPAITAQAPDNVTFDSGLSNAELASLLDTADLFVMPSVLEGFGLVYIEALSAGTPIVFTRNTGPEDFCVDGEHGYRVEYSSIESMRRVFEKLPTEREALREMRPRCRERAKELNWIRFRKGIRAAVLQDQG